MRPATALRLREQLTDRDHAILRSLLRFRVLTTGHLRRLHFTDHATDLAAARACNRVLQRLGDHGLITALERRIGGARRGSASLVWQLGATGENYLRTLNGAEGRKRYVEPGGQFVRHTLAVNDVAVDLLGIAAESTTLTIDALDTEPGNWRRFIGAAGETVWLRPDLRVVASNEDTDGTYETHQFLEIDLGTEHTPRIQAKCRVYAAYAATGAYQARHGLFPTVVWLSADRARRARLRAAVATTRGLPPNAFRVTSPARYLTEVRGE